MGLIITLVVGFIACCAVCFVLLYTEEVLKLRFKDKTSWKDAFKLQPPKPKYWGMNRERLNRLYALHKKKEKTETEKTELFRLYTEYFDIYCANEEI